MLNWESNKTLTSWGFLVLRVVVGFVFLMHGWQKLTMMGFDGVAGFLGSLGIPFAYGAAVLVTLVELVGGAAIMLGLVTRYASILTAATVAVAILTVHLPNGFFMADNGIELTLTLLAASAFFVLAGPGPISVDAKLFSARETTSTQEAFSNAAAD